MGREVETVAASTMNSFECYSWPGNVRELQNLVERAVIRSNNGVLPNPLPDKNPVMVLASRDTFTASTRALILHALGSTGWVIGGAAGAAARLGLKRTTLIAKMKKLGISRPAQQTETIDLTKNGEGEEVPTGA